MSVDTIIAQYATPCSTKRPTTTRDAGGSVINTYTTSLTAVNVYLQQTGGTEPDLMGSRRNVLTAVGYVAVGTSILPQDRVFVGTVYWDVQEVRTPDERSSADGISHMRLALTRTLPL